MDIKNIILILLALVILPSHTKSLYSQSEADFENIFFGDIIKSNNSVRSFEITKNNNLLCVQSNHPTFVNFSRGKTQFTFSLITDLTLPNTRSIQFKGDGKNANLISYTFLGENILGLSTQSTLLQRGPSFYFHMINPDLKAKTNHGHPVSIFNSRYNDVDYSRIAMVSREDAKHAAILYLPRTKPNEHTLMKYAVFNADYSAPIQNEMIFEYASREFNPIDFYISNQEEQLFITGHYPKSSKGNQVRETSYYNEIGIHYLKNNHKTTFFINHPSIFFADVEIYPENEGILLKGLYTSNVNNGVEGIYTARLSKTGEVEWENFSLFHTLIQERINEFQNMQVVNTRLSQYETSTFNILEHYKTEDGYISIIEFNAIEYRYGGTDMPGSTSTIDTYYWSGDVIVSKVSLQGQILWSKIIPKSQRTINDGGYYLSTATYLSDNHLHLFFNDSQNNYKDGVYQLSSDHPDFAKFGNTNNTVAHTSINITNGDVQRKNIIGKAETKVIFVPKLSLPIKAQNKLFIYAVDGKKHRLGSITFPKTETPESNKE